MGNRKNKVDIPYKNRYNTLIGKMLGINGNINRTDEFQKANIQLKTIRIEENNTIITARIMLLEIIIAFFISITS